MALIKQSLFVRLALLILCGTALVVLAIVSVNHLAMRRLLLDDQEQYYTVLASSAASKFNLNLLSAQQAVDEAVVRFEILPRTRSAAVKLLQDTLARDQKIYGSAVALAPSQDERRAGFRILYSWRDQGQVQTMERTRPQQDYQSDWFYLPYYQQQALWTDPYYDSDVETLMITYSAPVVVDRQVVAVITCDLSLAGLQASLEGLELGKQGQPLLVSEYGKIILHPNRDWASKETFYSLHEAAASREDSATMLRIADSLTEKLTGSLRFKRYQRSSHAFLYFGTIPTTGWKIGFIIPEEQILAPVVALGLKTTAIAIGGILLLLLPAFFIARTISRPLAALCGAADQLAGGNFAASLPSSGRSDEIGRLISDFDRMRRDLQTYIAELTTTTAAKEKIESELSIAREIQHSILPKIFPPFPQRSGLDIYALLDSAREVGGDLYDFSLLDEQRLYICIGDVSGKGVPASLFMAVGKTLLKSTIQTIPDPARALFHVNNELAQGNESCMFITTFCAILDLATNELTYANAGHNPPLIVAGEQAHFLPFASSPPLAAMADAEFTNQRITLTPETRFFLYTDGVTEAMNNKQELFGEERLQRHLVQHSCQTAEGCISMVAKAVREFAAGAEQSDDITMLCVSSRGAQAERSAPNSPTTSLRLTNHLAELPRMVAWLRDLQARLGWSQDLLGQLNLVLEEWLVNVISYAFSDAQLHEIELRLWQDDTEIRIEICDDGIPFDPTASASPEMDLPLEELRIGGLGLLLIQNSLDDFEYQRRDGLNVVTMSKRRNLPSDPQRT